MVILEDTRQQAGKHENITAYFDKVGIAHDRCALYVGDYMIANDNSISIDTKQDVRELAMDLHRDHERFKRECQRAQAAGIQLIILVEEALPNGKLLDWVPPRGCGIRPDQLRKQMITMMVKYGVRFDFCDGRSTGKRVVELLTERGKW